MHVKFNPKDRTIQPKVEVGLQTNKQGRAHLHPKIRFNKGHSCFLPGQRGRALFVCYPGGKNEDR